MESSGPLDQRSTLDGKVAGGGKFGDHHVGQQPSGWDALVDDLRRDWCLGQRFAVITDPFATHMAFNGKHAGRVVQLLANVLADALECAAAWAVSVVRFVMDQCAGN